MVFPYPDHTYQVIPDQDLPDYSELGSGPDFKAWLSKRCLEDSVVDPNPDPHGSVSSSK